MANPTPPTVNQTSPALGDLNPTAFVDDLYNSVHFYCSGAFDELDSVALRELDLSTPQAAELAKGTAAVFMALRKEYCNRLEIFEQYALEEILRVPPGLLMQTAQDDGDVAEVDDAEEQAADAKLVELRKQITAAKSSTRAMQHEIAELARLTETCSSHLERLKGIPEVLASKENLMEDIKVISEKGQQLEAGYMKLEELRKEQSHQKGGTATVEMTDRTAEKEILRRQAAMKTAPLEDMKRLQERINGNAMS